MAVIQSGHVATADSIAEDTIIDLEAAQEFFWEVWERWFSQIDEPANWAISYQTIQRTMTAYKVLMDRIVDDLLAAYSMGREYRIEQMKVLIESNKEALGA